MRLKKAIRIVARHAVSNAAAVDVDWQDYPELGERDWQAVAAEINRLTPTPDLDRFGKAYELLSARADR
jgi:hypothetical protein